MKAIGAERPMSETGALAYWFDISTDIRREWLDWYLTDHMPSRVGTAFVTGRCYEAIDAAASHMVLFETPTPEDLLAPSYLALLSQVSDADRARRGWYSRTVRVVCRAPARRGRGLGSVLGVLRLQGVEADGDARRRIASTLARDVVPALAEASGIGSVWLIANDPALRASMDAARVTGHADASADWAVLVEGGHATDVRAALAGVPDLAAWRELDLARVARFEQYRLLYAMTAADRR